MTEEPRAELQNAAVQSGHKHTCPECGSNNTDGPDYEGLFDCLDCGCWFDLEEAEQADREGPSPRL